MHKECVLKVELMSKTEPISCQLSSLEKEQQAEARVALKSGIESIRYLARQGLAMRGHKNDFVNAAGFKKWNKLTEKCDTHKNSPLHKECVLKVELMSKTEPISCQLSSLEKEQQAEARVALKSVIESICHLARQGLAMRGHENDSGNSKALLNLRKTIF